MPRTLGKPKKKTTCFFSLGLKSLPTDCLSTHIDCVQIPANLILFSVMEETHHNLGFVAEPQQYYSKELDVAVRAVQMACSLCQKQQENLIPSVQVNNLVLSKDDNFPVKVADWSVQAIVGYILSECLGSENVSILAKRDFQTLSKDSESGLLEAIIKSVNESLSEASRFGVILPKSALATSEILKIISHCNSVGSPNGRFWVLNPVDGALGFVCGDQYAVGLALIEDGEIKLGVLGCPNYPMRKDWLSYHHQYHRIISKLSPPTSETWNKGCVLYATKGSGKAWMQPLLHVNKTFMWPNSARQVSISSIDNLALATFCEPVEKPNSCHSFTVGLAHSVGLRNQPLRVHNMVKYAAIAHGDAEVFMRFAGAGSKEKIWDHAAGVVIIQEAGGVVTDARGRPLDFSKGIYLESLFRGVVACSGGKLHEQIIDAVDDSWASSCL